MRIPHPHFPDRMLIRIRPFRVLIALVLLTGSVTYVVFRSDRFQNMLRRRAERVLSTTFSRKVLIGGFDVKLLPPSFRVRDVWIANDPRGLPGPCFSASEITIDGLPIFRTGRISLGKLRVVKPRLVLEVFADGSTNLTSLFAALPKSQEGGLEVRLRNAVIQKGTVRFREFESQLDTELEESALTAQSEFLSPIIHASFASGRVRLRLEDNEELAFVLSGEVVASKGRLHLSSLRIRSESVNVDLSGGLDDLTKPELVLAMSAHFTGEALTRYFGVGLPLTGLVASSGTLRIPFGRPYLIRGRFEIPDGRLGPFPMTGSGFVRVDPKGLLAGLEEAEYAGGRLEALVRLERMKNPPLPVRIVCRARGVDFERFFADIDLPGTGLMARADLDTTLTFGRGGIEKADGAGELRLVPDGKPSAVKGRHALPVAGGGPLLIRAGAIGFAKTAFDTEGGARVLLDGTLALGSWVPDLRWNVSAADLSEVERLAENLFPAIQKEPLQPPLHLGGAGRLEARLTRSFSDPRVEGELSATRFVLKDVPFDDVSAQFTVDRRVLTLSPFAASLPGQNGRLALTGDVGWGGALKGEYRLDGLTLEVARWPIERILKFLTFDLPLEGRVTGRLSLAGVTPRVTGAVPLVWEEALVWGQPVDRAEGLLTFESDRLRLDDVTAKLSKGSLRGRGFYGYDKRDYAFSATGRDVPLEKLASFAEALPGAAALATGALEGSGTLERPSLTASMTLANPTYEGKYVGGKASALGLEVSLKDGRLAMSLGSEGHARLEVESEEKDSKTLSRVHLSIDDLTPFARFIPLLERPDARPGGRLVAEAVVSSDGNTTVKGTLQSAELSAFARTFTLARPAPFAFTGGTVSFEGLDVSAAQGFAIPAPAREPSDLGTLSLSGRVGTEAPHVLSAHAKGRLDASFADLVWPDVHGKGPASIDLAISGTTDVPILSGPVRLDGVELAFSEGTSAPVEALRGTLLFTPERVSTSDLNFRYGGAVSLAGGIGLKGLSPNGIRLNAHIERLRNRPFPGFSAVVSGDLALTGDTTVRVARGELAIERGVYNEDVALGLSSLLSGLSGASRPAPVTTPFDEVGLEVRILAPPSSIQIRNNVARLTAEGELLARGTFGRPVLFGHLEAEEGGRLFLRGVKYELVSGKLLFSNPAKIDPFFELSARTQIKDYQLRLGLTGTASRLAPVFESDPPLSQAQIVSLLASGELPGASAGLPTGTSPVSTDESINKAARELIAGAVTEAVADRTKQLFRLDRLQIDPVFVGSSFDAPRFTIGKSLSKDLTVTYSYKASADREQIILVEYQLSRNAFLQFVKDETGVYSVDLKIRQRLR